MALIDGLLTDTTKLKGAAKHLLGGVLRLTKDGVEITFRDRDAALENIAKYVMPSHEDLEKLPENIKIKQMTVDSIEATKIYQKLMAGD